MGIKKGIEEVKEIINRHKHELEEKYKVKNVGIFGSYVRGEQSEASDIDVLVEFREPVGFLFIHLGDFLEQILQSRVDLITSEAIKPNRQKYIMEELIYV